MVDDEPMLLDLAATILQPLGYDVRTFRDPKRRWRNFPIKPAVLVTDYAMGGMNGLDLMRECRRINPRQKVLLLSGTVDENIYAGAEDKPDRFLAKPYQVGEFVESGEDAGRRLRPVAVAEILLAQTDVLVVNI